MTTNEHLNTICRLCLYSGYQNWHILGENTGIIFKIHSCLNIKITSNELLPAQICQVCCDKIEDIYKFHQSILENESKLLNSLNSPDETSQNIVKQEIIDSQDTKNFSIFIDLKSTDIKDEESDTEEYDTLSQNVEFTTVVKRHRNRHKKLKNAESKELINPDSLNNKPKQKITENLINNSDTIQNIPIENKTLNKIKKKQDSEFKCLMCFHVFDTFDLLHSHYLLKHTDKSYKNSIKPVYTCSKTEDGSLLRKCGKCNESFLTKRCMDRHWIQKHVTDRPFVCKVCSRTYKMVEDFARHARVHKENYKMFCSFDCGYSTAYKGAMTDHEKRHKKDFKYVCEDCGRGFNVQTSYSQHLNIHKGIKPFNCDVCNMDFTMDKYLYQHKVKVHGISPVTKRYICVHCSKPFDSKYVLNQHLKEHGKIVSFHLCDICGKDFPTLSKLNLHKNSHIGLRPYSCSICPKTFAKKCNLKLHEVTHTGEKNFTCDHCAKQYTQKSTLQRHVTKYHAGAETSKATTTATLTS